MAKKKRVPVLTSLDKAFAIAAGFPYKSPEKYKEYLTNFKQTYKRTIDTLQMDSFWEAHEVTKEALAFFDPNDETALAERYGRLLLEFWRRDKRCYTFTESSISFIDEKMHLEEFYVDTDCVFRVACNEPTYIEFPKGRGIKGMFCGCTRMLDSETHLIADENHPIMVMIILYEDDEVCPTVVVERSGNFPISLPIRDAEPDDSDDLASANLSLIFKAIAYLGYTRTKHDSYGSVFTSYPRQGCKCYYVNPIPFSDWVPEYDREDAWMLSGLATTFRFLSRENMKANITNRIEELTKEQIENPQDSASRAALRIANAVLEWEGFRGIYQYSDRSSDLLVKKYFPEFIKNGFPSSKLDYLPASSIVLYQKDANIKFLVTVISEDNTVEKKLLAVMLDEDPLTLQTLDLDTPFESDDEPQNDEMYLRMYCVLIHVLEVFEKIALKRKMELGCLQDGSVLAAPASGSRKSMSEKTSLDAQIHYGTPVSDIPFSLFHITPKKVSRASKKEMEQYYGWKMIPHIRRRHVHHYWVGTGADRHLEARILEPMKINHTENTPPVTTIRQVV